MTTLQLLRNIRLLTWTFVIGLVLSGVTAIPLTSEIDVIVKHFTATNDGSLMATWLLKVAAALHSTESNFPFLFYGTDWLAFGHIVIAIAFVGALRDPVRNKWLFDFGLIACVLVIPWAFVFGAVRGIPVFWRLIDCSFGLFGIAPLWLAKRWTRQLEQSRGNVMV